jgi:nucleotide-binding universal stress UspA family protein
MTRVVVGMDESEGAAHALRWAVEESAGRDWHIRALLAWSALDPQQLTSAETFEPDDNGDTVRKTLTAAVERAVGTEAWTDRPPPSERSAGPSTWPAPATARSRSCTPGSRP